MTNQMSNFKEKLHDTCQPHIKFTAFDNLPGVIKDSIMRHAELTATCENSSYTLYRDLVFIRGTAAIEGSVYKYEINLGELDDYPSIDLLIECFDFDNENIYLTEVA